MSDPQGMANVNAPTHENEPTPDNIPSFDIAPSEVGNEGALQNVGQEGIETSGAMLKPWDKVTIALEGWEYKCPASWAGKDPATQENNAKILTDLLNAEAQFATMNKQRDMTSASDADFSYTWRFSLYGETNRIMDAVSNIIGGFTKILWNWKTYSGNAYAIVAYKDKTEKLIRGEGIGPSADLDDAVDKLSEQIFKKVEAPKPMINENPDINNPQNSERLEEEMDLYRSPNTNGWTWAQDDTQLTPKRKGSDTGQRNYPEEGDDIYYDSDPWICPKCKMRVTVPAVVHERNEHWMDKSEDPAMLPAPEQHPQLRGPKYLVRLSNIANYLDTLKDKISSAGYTRPEDVKILYKISNEIEMMLRNGDATPEEQDMMDSLLGISYDMVTGDVTEGFTQRFEEDKQTRFDLIDEYVGLMVSLGGSKTQAQEDAENMDDHELHVSIGRLDKVRAQAPGYMP